MNLRKLLLSSLREGDYAHPGEEEAIELTMQSVTKSSKCRFLDVGCGLGGTANYIEQHGWGKVTAIDIAPDMIAHVQQQYPQIRTICCNANELDEELPTEKFDVIYSFSAFFCFPQQEKTLNVLSKISNANTQLIIFDYTSPRSFTEKNPFLDSKVNSPCLFNPINTKDFATTLQKNNWQLQQYIDLSAHYKTWYEWLLANMNQRETELANNFGSNTFTDLYDGYQRLLKLIVENKIGGGIFKAIPNTT
ncbi:MAG TPA: methyltransferase domain-containing protein [Gammaproteobacteria bacterium]|nr:methyltransferase domain-containing protein [Gammaproteobacteria bacterium]